MDAAHEKLMAKRQQFGAFNETRELQHMSVVDHKIFIVKKGEAMCAAAKVAAKAAKMARTFAGRAEKKYVAACPKLRPGSRDIASVVWRCTFARRYKFAAKKAAAAEAKRRKREALLQKKREARARELGVDEEAERRKREKKQREEEERKRKATEEEEKRRREAKNKAKVHAQMVRPCVKEGHVLHQLVVNESLRLDWWFIGR